MNAAPETRRVPDDDAGRADAVAALRRGALIALPTDTVYGVAVALEAPDGLSRLFAAKERPLDRAIILLVDSLAQVEALVDITPAARVLAEAFWPGGLSLVLRQRPGAALPPTLTGGQQTLGIRVPAHPTPRSLARAVGPLPTTSANRSGQTDALDADEVLAQLGGRIELVLDGGRVAGGVPSSVVDCAGAEPRLLRSGAITAGRIAEVLEAAGLVHRVREGGTPHGGAHQGEVRPQ